ncbi:hypothetical protein ACQPZX_22255 [Actinoplanes sp. CA-142083]|uniref:hypothetical protein n=1 Tax=Actinoplanes sp. CA-142083 TaxID=3239903 RepID=UPI003D8B422D
MPAVIEATRTMARRAVRPETPARLRLWVAVTVVTAAALLATLSLLMARVQEQVRIIGDEAAPQAATAADLYFALSDMDAQVARMVLTGGDDALAGTQIDALGTYQERSRQVDADLQKSLTTSSTAADRAAVLTLLDHLAVYRERVWQTLTAGDAAAGFYTQATNVLHLDLLPAAQALKDASEKRLDDAYAGKKVTQVLAVTCALVLGIALLILLLTLQVWLARRFRRVFSPALLVATVLTVLLIVPAIAVLVLQGQRLGEARDESLSPFLALSQARAISYDAAADTSRYLISENLAYYDDDFKKKAACLVNGDSCEVSLPVVAGGPDVSPFDAEQVASRWQAYQKDHQKIIALAAAGKKDEAVGVLTGIRRGDAAFDFTYFDAAVGEIADERQADFDQAMDDTSTLLTGWAVIPLVVMGLVIVLVPVAVRKRFAEYR